MVAENCLTQQVYAEMLRLMNQLLIEPQLAMIIILAGELIIAQQKAAANRAVHDMHNRNFIRRKHLDTRQSSHDPPPFNLKQQSLNTQAPHSSTISKDISINNVCPLSSPFRREVRR